MDYRDLLALQQLAPGFAFDQTEQQGQQPLSMAPPATQQVQSAQPQPQQDNRNLLQKLFGMGQAQAQENQPPVPMQQQFNPGDFKKLAAQQALKMLIEPEQKQSNALPLAMMLTSIGQDIQTPRYLRGVNNNSANMANNLLAWQVKNQLASEAANQKKVNALATLEKLSEGAKPMVVGNALVNPQTGQELYRGDKFTNVSPGGSVVNTATGQEVYKAPDKPVNPHFVTGYDDQGNAIVSAVDPKTLQTTRVNANFGNKDYKSEWWVDKNNPSQGEWVKPGQIPSNPNLVQPSVYGSMVKMPEMPEDVKNEYGKAYALYGKDALPKVSGFMQGPLLADIQTRGIKYLKDNGLNVSDMLSNQSEYGGLQTELKQLMGQRGKILSFAKTADENLKQALELSKKVDRFGVPVINRWYLAGKRELAGDPDVSAFNAANQVAINEFAKVTSSATGGGVTSDTARKEIENVLNTAQTPEQYLAVYNTLKRDMDNRVAGFENRMTNIRNRFQEMGGVLKSDQSSQTQTTPQTQQQQTNFRRELTNRRTGEKRIITDPEEYRRLTGGNP